MTALWLIQLLQGHKVKPAKQWPRVTMRQISPTKKKRSITQQNTELKSILSCKIRVCPVCQTDCTICKNGHPQFPGQLQRDLPNAVFVYRKGGCWITTAKIYDEYIYIHIYIHVYVCIYIYDITWIDLLVRWGPKNDFKLRGLFFSRPWSISDSNPRKGQFPIVV